MSAEKKEASRWSLRTIEPVVTPVTSRMEPSIEAFSE